MLRPHQRYLLTQGVTIAIVLGTAVATLSGAWGFTDSSNSVEALRALSVFAGVALVGLVAAGALLIAAEVCYDLASTTTVCPNGHAVRIKPDSYSSRCRRCHGVASLDPEDIYWAHQARGTSPPRVPPPPPPSGGLRVDERLFRFAETAGLVGLLCAGFMAVTVARAMHNGALPGIPAAGALQAAAVTAVSCCILAYIRWRTHPRGVPLFER